MSADNRLEVVHQKPIRVPEQDLWFAREGLMALTTVDGKKVYGRGIPQNTIFSGRLIQEDDNLRLDIDKQPVLTPQNKPQTEDRRQVTGYEDPTLIPATDNPFSPLKEGVLCTQTYPATPREGVYTNLVYFEPNLLKAPEYNPRAILTPSVLMRQPLYFPRVDMVKEGEILPKDRDNRQNLLFEFADGKASHIGLGLMDEGKVEKSLHFLTANNDNSEHVSTAGAPVRLEDGRWLLFFNRRRNNEWGISFMTLHEDFPYIKLEIYPDWLIRAPQNVGRGPGGQLIAFGSCVYKLEDRLLRVLYHVNDNSVYESLVEMKGLL